MIIKKSIDFLLIDHFLENTFSSPTHWPEWNKIISKYYNSDFYYFVASIEEKVVGICPIHMNQKNHLNKLSSGQYMYIPYGGWIFNENLPAIKPFFPLKFNQAISGFSLPIGDHFPSYSLPLSPKTYQTLLVDLTQDENGIWENCIDSKRRNKIRKAINNNLIIEVVNENNYNSFYQFYTDSNNRYGLQSLKKECLFDLLFSTKTSRFLATYIKHEGTIISSHVMAYDKTLALYWLGLNAEKMPNLGQGELLQWDAIKNAKKMGCLIYDLCYIEKERLPSIYEFKKGFSRKEVPVFSFSIMPTSYKLMNKIARLILH